MSDKFIKLIRNNVSCTIVYFGASLARVEIREADNSFKNIVLPLEFDMYGKETTLAGTTLGPCSGRIKDGEIVIGDEIIYLEKNEGTKHIHGGSHGLSHTEFSLVDIEETKEYSRVILSAALPDKLDGWPGNRIFTVTYTLFDSQDSDGSGGSYGINATPVSCKIRIDLEATTDADTFVDMSNHTYWNLNGNFEEEGSGLLQKLSINADKFLLIDEEHLPTTLADTKDAFDFKSQKMIKELTDKYSDEWQLNNANGYNHAFILNDFDKKTPAATLTSMDDSLTMNMYTDQSAIMMYSGGYLPINSNALALEAQGWPDACHVDGAPFKTLEAGKIYKKYIEFELVKKQIN